MKFYTLAFMVGIVYLNCISQIHTTQYIPGEVDTKGIANYALYIPYSLEQVRGIYFRLPGWQGSSLSVVNNETYKTLVEKHNFALLGVQMLGSYTSNVEEISLWSGEGTLVALERLAEISDHHEIKDVPIYLEGISAGGQFAYHFTRFKPDKVIAFLTMKGGYHTLADNYDDVRKVPGYMFIGEFDLPYRLTNLSTIFYNNRPYGALWTLAIEPNSGHSRVNDTSLLFSYFRSIISVRLPESTIPGEQVQLREIDAEIGWLGDATSQKIGSYECYNLEIDKACWFPDEENAKIWQSFVSSGIVSDVLVCTGTNSLSFQNNLEISILPNPAKEELILYYEGIQPASIQYELFDITGVQISEGELISNRISIKEYKRGIYLLVIKIKNLVFTEKIIKN